MLAALSAGSLAWAEEAVPVVEEAVVPDPGLLRGDDGEACLDEMSVHVTDTDGDDIVTEAIIMQGDASQRMIIERKVFRISDNDRDAVLSESGEWMPIRAGSLNAACLARVREIMEAPDRREQFLNELQQVLLSRWEDGEYHLDVEAPNMADTENKAEGTLPGEGAAVSAWPGETAPAEPTADAETISAMVSPDMGAAESDMGQPMNAAPEPAEAQEGTRPVVNGEQVTTGILPDAAREVTAEPLAEAEPAVMDIAAAEEIPVPVNLFDGAEPAAVPSGGKAVTEPLTDEKTSDKEAASSKKKVNKDKKESKDNKDAKGKKTKEDKKVKADKKADKKAKKEKQKADREEERTEVTAETVSVEIISHEPQVIITVKSAEELAELGIRA